MTIHEKINHRVKVTQLAKTVNNHRTNRRPMLVAGFNYWLGVCEPFGDPEDLTIYRDNLFELSVDTRLTDEEKDCRHCPNAF